MKRTITYILGILMYCICHSAIADDGVKCALHQITYNLIADKGKLTRVKTSEEYIFSTSSNTATAIAVTHYNDEIKVTKASAPDTKAEYLQDFDDGIFYNDTRVCILPVPLKKDKTAKAEFETIISNPALFGHIGITCRYPTEKYIVEINIPAELKEGFKISTLNMPSTTLLSETIDSKGNLAFKATLSNLSPYKNERLAPAISIAAPQIIVTGYFEDVTDLYSHMHQFIKDSPSEAVTSLASQLTKNCTDIYSKIDTISAWVRENIRYIAIEHGELGMRPDEPAQVLDKRYGDCKGSANLIKHMLKSQGIDSRLVWISSAGYTRLNWNEYPLSTLGNHMIAAAVLPDTIIYIDGTMKYAPKGHLSEQLQGQWAMIEDGYDKCIIQRVPEISGLNRDISQVSYTMEGNTLIGDVDRHLYGTLCQMYEDLYNTSTASKRIDAISRIIKGDNGSMSVSEFKYSRPYPNSPSLELGYRVTDNSRVKSAGEYMYIDINPIDYYSIAEVDTAGRTRGIELPFSYHVEKTSTLKCEAGTDGVKCPDTYVADNVWFDAKIEYAAEGNEIRCHAYLNIKDKKVALDDISQWNREVKSLRKALSARLKIPVR